jgi:hypothetical protein
MACSKYILTNTGSTLVNFSYRRCDDSLWDYQVELLPNQTKNIWVINGTYTVAPAFKGGILLVNEGAFPPISATSTPTPTPTVHQLILQRQQILQLIHQHQVSPQLKLVLQHQPLHQLIQRNSNPNSNSN